LFLPLLALLILDPFGQLAPASPRFLMRFITLFATLIGVYAVLAVSTSSAQPAWWTAQGVTNTRPADDFAVANIGQMKSLAVAAIREIDARRALSGGAGSALTGLMFSWFEAPPSGVLRDDYAALNQGQLKAVAAQFYDYLGITRPWSASSSDDDNYALVNLGQLKNVFSFSISSDVDSDSDGLLDSWETARFGGLGMFGTGNEDGDALSNRAENLAGSNPSQAATVVAASTLGLSVYSP
jgi:hypothetical protein